jgi:hypothetical protein
MLRAYSPELTGWFDDFGQSGKSDAFGGIGRIETTLNTFSAGPPGAGNPCSVVQILTLGGVGNPCSQLSPTDLLNAVGVKDVRRCPGANERGLSNDQLTQNGTINCNPDQKPLGP